MKIYNGLTAEERHRDMWLYLSSHPQKEKGDYMKDNNIIHIPKDYCFACDEALDRAKIYSVENICDLCPLGDNIGCAIGLYASWERAKYEKNFSLASDLAYIISLLPWEK